MSEEKSRTGAINVGIGYALNPISHFDSYVEKIAGFNGGANRDNMSRFAGRPVLISKQGEHVDERCRVDYQRKFANSGMLGNEDIARKVAADKGYLFFPGGKVEDSEFSRSFAFSDFVKGAEGIVGNIDREKYESYEAYFNFVSTEVEKMKTTLKYFDEATLKFNTNTFSSTNAYFVIGLNPDVIDGFGQYHTKGFEGAWVKMDIAGGRDNKSFFGDSIFNAQFYPRYIDNSFSKQDLSDISTIVQNVAGQNKARELKKGYSEEVHLEANKKDDSLVDFRLYMSDVEDFDRNLPVGEKVETFTKYLHLVQNGIRAVADMKERKRETRIDNLEGRITELSK